MKLFSSLRSILITCAEDNKVKTDFASRVSDTVADQVGDSRPISDESQIFYGVSSRQSANLGCFGWSRVLNPTKSENLCRVADLGR